MAPDAVIWDPASSAAELDEAIRTWDRPRVAVLCRALRIDIRGREPGCATEPALSILRQLRRSRYFPLVQELADALMQAGSTDQEIRRNYAQALIDQGAMTAASAVLEPLVAAGTDTADDTADHTVDDTADDIEVWGLLARVQKQIYVETPPTAPQRRAELLGRAVGIYLTSYRRYAAPWHGINAVALLDCARRDGVAFPGLGISDPAATARAMAREILAAVFDPASGHGLWGSAIAMEACVALDRPGTARDHAADFVAATDVGAFEIASALRQLEQVWGLTVASGPAGLLITDLRAALLRDEGAAEVPVARVESIPTTLRRLENDHGFEKVFGTERFDSWSWFRTALKRCEGVGRVEDRNGVGVGTGFLLRGADLLPSLPPVVFVTNAHVIDPQHPAHPDALGPADARVTFRALGDERPYRVARVLKTSPPGRLDTTVVELDALPTAAVPLPIAAHRPRLNAGPYSRTFVVGHPSAAEQVMLSVRDNQLLDADDRLVHYRTPTMGGSSGSPVFDRYWDLVAVHHAGSDTMRRLNGKAGVYSANEGIWIDAIRRGLGEATA